LEEISKHVTALFESSAATASLVLSLPDERLTIFFGRMTGQARLGSATFAEDPELERLIRQLFLARGLKLPNEDWTPIHFVPGIPVQSIYSISPFPTKATDTLNRQRLTSPSPYLTAT
jgi:hypothetical protein